MRLTLPNEADIYFHEMDASIRKAAAARKRGDFERESFWLGEMRKFARMHGKAVKNANAGISETKEAEKAENRNPASVKHRQAVRDRVKKYNTI